jgi:hypothetical protein
MELGPNVLALLTRLRELDPTTIEGLLRNPSVAARASPAVNLALPVPVLPPGASVVNSSRPHTLLEKCGPPAADLLMAHYGTYLPPFEQVFPTQEVARFAEVLSLSVAERHLDPRYARTSSHKARVFFCHDAVQGNLPASVHFDMDWLVTENLELLHEDLFETKVVASPAGGDYIPEASEDDMEDLYVVQAAVLPSCLGPNLLRLLRIPIAAWRLLRSCATELGLLNHCSGLWRLLRALASTNHRKDSCMSLDLIDGNAHFVGSRRAVLETILPALAAAPLMLGPAPTVGDAAGTATLAAAIEAATRPAAQKIVTVEEKWPHSYGWLLLLAGVANVEGLHNFWHDCANQKKAQRWAHMQSAVAAMAGSLGLETPTILAKTV